MIPFCPLGCFFTRRVRLTATNVHARSFLDEIRKTRERREGRYSSERTGRREAERGTEREARIKVGRYPQISESRPTRAGKKTDTNEKGRSHESACYPSRCQAQNRHLRGELRLWEGIDMVRCERLLCAFLKRASSEHLNPRLHAWPWALPVRRRCRVVTAADG